MLTFPRLSLLFTLWDTIISSIYYLHQPFEYQKTFKITFCNNLNCIIILNAYHCHWLQGNALKLHTKIFRLVMLYKQTDYKHYS